MKRPGVLLIVIVLDLLALVALGFAYPQPMVSPGSLLPGHEALAGDCFACHVPWRGAQSRACLACHPVADIGLRTTQGQPIPRAAGDTIQRSFHQDLLEQDCLACHSDHPGSRSSRRSREAFSHALLKPALRGACSSCHAAPRDTLHRSLRDECGQCHRSEAWRPASFDHARFFVLDRDHQAPCETCHRDQDHSRYTCYGCHEHAPASVRAEHLEEGIRDVEDCVSCHRDPGVEPAHGGGPQRGRDTRD